MGVSNFEISMFKNSENKAKMNENVSTSPLSMTPRASQSILVSNLLTPQNTEIATGYESVVEWQEPLMILLCLFQVTLVMEYSSLVVIRTGDTKMFISLLL